jgi:site-specific DNA recombinase
MKIMLTNQVINAEMKLKVFYRRAREAGQLEMQMQADYQYRQSLMSHEFIEINEGNVSTTKFIERSCIRQLIKLIELGNVDTLYVYDASRLTRNMSNHFELMASLNKHNVRLVFNGSSEIDMPNKLLGLWEGFKIG